MRIYYATTKSYPASTADHIYIRELSRGFVKSGSDFCLVVSRTDADLDGIPTTTLPSLGSKSFSFLIWILRFGFSRDTKESVFMANDFNILSILVWAKRVFRFKYKICSDLHMLSETAKDRVALSGSDIIVTTSERLKNVVVSRFPAVANRSIVVYGGVDPDMFQEALVQNKVSLRKKLSLPVDGVLVGYVGLFKTMGMDKGIKTMIESIPFAQAYATYVFVGGSKEEIGEYSNYAKAQNVENRCLFVPRQEYTKVPLYECAMDVLVIPYPNEPHFSEYGFPMKVYEYLESGIPLVYSNLEIIDEVLRGKGVSFKAGDAESLAKAIKVSLSTKGRHSADARYSWQGKARAIASLFKERLGEKLESSI